MIALSVSIKEEWLSGKGRNKRIEGRPPQVLVEALTYFVEATDDKVDDLLDTWMPEGKLLAAGKRLELGYHASCLLMEIESEIQAEPAEA